MQGEVGYKEGGQKIGKDAVYSFDLLNRNFVNPEKMNEKERPEGGEKVSDEPNTPGSCE